MLNQMMSLVRKLRAEIEDWKQRFRKEAQSRAALITLNEQHQKTVSELEASQKMADSMKKIANEEVASLKKSWTKERSKLRRDVKEWRMRYHAESLWQVDVSTLKCELVNCGYRKEAATQQRRIDQLEKQVASLSSDLRRV